MVFYSPSRSYQVIAAFQDHSISASSLLYPEWTRTNASYLLSLECHIISFHSADNVTVNLQQFQDTVHHHFSQRGVVALPNTAQDMKKMAAFFSICR